MKILQLANKIPYPANDGSSIAIYTLAKGFIDNDADLTLLCLNPSKHKKDIQSVPDDFKRSSKLQAVDVNNEITPLKAVGNLISGKAFHISRFYCKEFASLLKQTLKEQTFDIIHIDGLFMTPYLSIIRENSNAKVVMRAHNIEHLIWERMLNHEKSSIKKSYLKLQAKRLKKYELAILPKVDAIIPISTLDADVFKEIDITTKMHVCEGGLNLPEYVASDIKPDEKSVFHLGSLDWMPSLQGISWFLNEVWQKVIKQEPKAKFYIAGRNIPQSVQSQQSDNIQIVGEVADSKQFMSSKQLMIVPLLSGSGIRIKILEGMAMGKAIVATKVGAEGIKCEHSKEIMIADDAQSFANHIIELLKSDTKMQEIGKNARNLVSQSYDNKKQVAELLEFYNSL